MKNRKKRLMWSIFISLLPLTTINVCAQQIQLSPFLGYGTGTKLKSINGNLEIQDAMNFGVSLDIGLGGGRFADLSYGHGATELSVDQGPNYTPISNLGISLYSLGLMQEFTPHSKTTPYGLLSLGVIRYAPIETDTSDENLMHLSLAAGVKSRLNEKMSLKFQARILVPFYPEGKYFASPGFVAGYELPSGIHGVQADFTAALVIMIR
jgi:hypothetical protein